MTPAKDINRNYLVLWSSLVVVCLVSFLIALRYTQSENKSGFNLTAQDNQLFNVTKIGTELSADIKNKNLEEDTLKTQQDLLQISQEIGYLNHSKSSEQEVNSLKERIEKSDRLSPPDKTKLINSLKTETYTEVEQKFIVYLNNSVQERFIAITNKILPRQEALPNSNWQTERSKNLYNSTRVDINSMRNLNAETYKLIVEDNEKNIIKENFSSIQVLGNTIQENIYEIIRLLKQVPELN